MKRLLILFLCLFIGNTGIAAEVKILHTSDIHGRISPVEYKGKPNCGGFSRRLSFVNQIRSNSKNVLLLDSGDYFQGSLYYRLDFGKSSAKLLQEIKYDAIALGNHEFDNGTNVLKHNIKNSKTQFLSANVHFRDKYLQKAVKPYIIKDYDGEKFLIIGVTTSKLASLSNTNNITVTNPIEEINKIIKAVKYDKLIILSHCGLEEDRSIAKNIPQIDLILGGHNHYFFNVPEYVKEVPIVQDGEFGIRVGIIDFNQKLKHYTYKNITPEIKSDINIDEKIAKLDNHNKKVSNEILAKSEVLLIGDQTTIEHNQTNLGKLVLISMTKAFKNTYYDGIITNSGSIRINKNFKGNISYADVLEILPFENDIVLVEVQGNYLKKILQRGMQNNRRYLQYYLKDKNIDNNKTYKIITNSYIVSGKDGYEEFKNSKIIKHSNTNPAKLLKQTLQEMKVLTDENLNIDNL
ncbi:bifunctional metallophosphatase/5'-nucleotidase [bacterium]|nr:bifunctional metallophosphatase/5'-nucleotidase [bacterium]